MIIALFYYFGRDASVYILAFVPLFLIIEYLAVRMIMKIVLINGDPGKAAVTLNGITDEDAEMRTVTITMSRYMMMIEQELFIDDVKIADSGGGDVFKIPLTRGDHRLTVKIETSVAEMTIPAGGECEIYVKFERFTKNAINIEDVTGRKEEAIALDTASSMRFKRNVEFGGVLSQLFVALVITAILVLIF
jgi:hypothetical protein